MDSNHSLSHLLHWIFITSVLASYLLNPRRRSHIHTPLPTKGNFHYPLQLRTKYDIHSLPRFVLYAIPRPVIMITFSSSPKSKG
ncbi:hypothetical protein BXZ70DRAFT_359394 [Cristinia sonorae]|uniref:Uncharacterized protein n=1 Tax=Cristinia sonorae TaxID=1940300 RepID=A0A8K0UL91_9AGAR|nr:hypothetical protein BXZ70DRAFT_359394 [Cristinia sonorae]